MTYRIYYKKMTTRKIILQDKYRELQNKINLVLHDDLFPSLEMVSIVDIVYLLTVNFKNVNTDQEYNIKINNLIDINCYNISEEYRQIIIPDIIEFIQYIKNI